MRALVTGATGKVGNGIARALLARGDDVRAMVRDTTRARDVLPEGVELVSGDVTDPTSVAAAVIDREIVFNSHGLPEQWRAEPGIFEAVNARGSENVAVAAREAGVRRLVHTSTIDVFHADRGARFDESEVADYPKGTEYERSKQLAEELVLAAAGDALEVVIANPAAVYGPGPAATTSLAEDFFVPLVEKKLPALPPGGLGVVHVDGATAGHLLVADRGKPGERYILCDQHIELRPLAQLVVRTAGRGRVPPSMPWPVARGLSVVGEGVSKLIKKPPLLPEGQLLFFRWNAAPDSSKAQRELGWQPTPLEDGVRSTLEALGV